MTRPDRRDRADRIPFAELERLVREKSYLRPLPPTPSLMQMAQRRTLPVATDNQAGDNNPKEKS